ncbi:uncharacterized protein VTP21DRAFT_10594 [Calcarisporiella thermophila]|uniref:uncharacterized protein n=1 Tax=Calcarisporiella thermophila TaxID=911321 RepID=UPI003742AC82
METTTTTQASTLQFSFPLTVDPLPPMPFQKEARHRRRSAPVRSSLVTHSMATPPFFSPNTHEPFSFSTLTGEEPSLLPLPSKALSGPRPIAPAPSPSLTSASMLTPTPLYPSVPPPPPMSAKRAAALTRRAAQNRAAQRAFRQRKIQYIKDLEDKATELEKLRESYELLKRENEQLHAAIQKYEQQQYYSNRSERHSLSPASETERSQSSSSPSSIGLLLGLDNPQVLKDLGWGNDGALISSEPLQKHALHQPSILQQLNLPDPESANSDSSVQAELRFGDLSMEDEKKLWRI